MACDHVLYVLLHVLPCHAFLPLPSLQSFDLFPYLFSSALSRLSVATSTIATSASKPKHLAQPCAAPIGSQTRRKQKTRQDEDDAEEVWAVHEALR